MSFLMIIIMSSWTVFLFCEIFHTDRAGYILARRRGERESNNSNFTLTWPACPMSNIDWLKFWCLAELYVTSTNSNSLLLWSHRQCKSPCCKSYVVRGSHGWQKNRGLSTSIRLFEHRTKIFSFIFEQHFLLISLSGSPVEEEEKNVTWNVLRWFPWAHLHYCSVQVKVNGGR